MATTSVDDVVQKQSIEFVLHAPVVPSTSTSSSTTSNGTTNGIDSGTATDSTMCIALVNNTSSSSVYAYITGLASDNNSAVFLLESDGKTVYYPTSPTSTGTALSADCAIKLGAAGSTTTVTIPRTAGGRIWFSQDATLTFLLNPGPSLVEPSVTNESDPNYNIYWDFCEFTFNAAELYVNISYVDFASLPIALQLENTSGTITSVEGLPSNGLEMVCAGLVAQTAKDGADWSDLIVKTSSGANLRALSPNSGITMNKALFSTYWDSYVSQVWAHYSNGAALTINTQASWGASTGTVTDDNVLTFGSAVGSFAAPSSANIFSCSTGPFATSTAQMGALGARLAAAFNRSTLLTNALQPDAEIVADYYTNPVTNHYARLMHATYLDVKGYAFPYDDVAPANGADQSGSLFDANPKLLTITVGGPGAAAKAVGLREMAPPIPQRLQHLKRDLDGRASPADDEKHMLAGDERNEEDSACADLEKGLGRGNHGLSPAKGGLSCLTPSTKDARGHVMPEPLSSSSSLMGRSLTSRIIMALSLVLVYLAVPLVSSR